VANHAGGGGLDRPVAERCIGVRSLKDRVSVSGTTGQAEKTKSDQVIVRGWARTLGVSRVAKLTNEIRFLRGGGWGRFDVGGEQRAI